MSSVTCWDVTHKWVGKLVYIMQFEGQNKIMLFTLLYKG
jgi:hypothetical protein